MRLSDFDYHLPPERIAQTPCEPRDAARLLVDRGDGHPEHRRVADLPDLLRAGDLLVLNDTRVLPARVHLTRRTGGHVEILVLEPIDERRWTALVRPGGKLRAGEILFDAHDRDVVVFHGRSEDPNSFVVEFLGDRSVESVLDELGEMPLPPYITTRLERTDRYQTVYSRRAASAAAPTAGLHFTPELFGRLRERRIDIAHVELVVGLDTFRPVQVEDPREHVMHSESYHVDAATMDRIVTAERVVAVGTTSVRTIESALSTGRLSGRTDLFVHEGFPWRRVDVMMTNFHLPRTTLLMMIDAFVGPRWRRLYDEALAAEYRFLSFGDAMLLDRHAT
ncbi:MAG: tRNA preQ1(34) S-adenosylmethionine ribosyltransferase-isomerase QueA [Actinomycetota bacterium]